MLLYCLVFEEYLFRPKIYNNNFTFLSVDGSGKFSQSI